MLAPQALGEGLDVGGHLELRVEPAAEVLDRAVAWARSLVETTSPASLRATKRQIWSDSTRPDPAASVRDAQARLDLMMTEPDYAEAVEAFVERRRPRWGQRPR